MVSLDLTGPEVRPLKSIFLGADLFSWLFVTLIINSFATLLF